MKKFCLFAILLAVFSITILGCSKNGKTAKDDPNLQPHSGNDKIFTIGMSQCNLGEPWRVQMNQDIQKAAEKYSNIKMIFKNAANKTTVQQDQIKELIDLGVDLIIVSPLESKPLTKPVADAYESGIPVIVLDRKVEGDKYTCFIGGDNRLIGEEAGKYVVKLLNGKGNVVEIKGLMTSTPAIERHEGFMKGIEGSEIKIIASVDAAWLETNAQKEMSSILTRFPGKDDIQLVYAHNDPSAHGAYNATKNEGKGREKIIKYIGIDGLPHEGVRYVKDGILEATFYYPTGGEEAIDIALKILNGEDVEKNITLGTKVIDKEYLSKISE
ncbi:MAG: substrate-binding domain-containing protein [Armatimonadota bacterium]